MWVVYLCRSEVDGSLYCGISTDVARRINQHNGISNKRNGQGAKCLRGKRPVVLVWQEKATSRSKALQREREIKRMSRVDKLRLVEEQHESKEETDANSEHDCAERCVANRSSFRDSESI
jgi:putative endonuclease